MFISKEHELHEMLKLHATDSVSSAAVRSMYRPVEITRCSCGILLHAGKPILPENHYLATLILGEDVMRRIALGTTNESDFAILKKFDYSPRHPHTAIEDLCDEAIQEKAESAQAEFIEAAIELYKKADFRVGRSVLRDPECNKLAESRWSQNGKLLCQAKAPIELGWNFVAETDTNITNGNKARIYERNGDIAFQHKGELTPIHNWRMQCRQLFLLACKVCGYDVIMSMCHPRIRRWSYMQYTLKTL